VVGVPEDQLRFGRSFYFLKVKTPFVNTLKCHFDITKPQSFTIDQRTMENVIGDMLFDPEDEEEQVSKDCALSFLKKDNDCTT
jgi:hypothetical protein